MAWSSVLSLMHCELLFCCGFAAIHMLIGTISTPVSSTYVMVPFCQYVAQTNVTFMGCKLLLTAESKGDFQAFTGTKIPLFMQCVSVYLIGKLSL